MKNKVLFILLAGSLAISIAFFIRNSGESKEYITSNVETSASSNTLKRRAKLNREGVGTLVKGQVYMNQGQPVPGAAIYHQSPGGQWRRLARPADENGAFRFRATEPGVHAFYAREGDAFSFERAADIAQVTVAPKHGPDIPIVLHMKNAVRWSATVLEEKTETPLVGAELRFPRLLGQSAFTDSDGRARFSLPRDLWKVQVLARGYEPKTMQLGPQTENNARLTITLKKGFGLAGSVIDTMGDPIPDTVVTLNQGGLSQRVFTNSDGEFLLSSLAAAQKGNLHFQKRGYRSQEMRGIQWPGAGTQQETSAPLEPIKIRVTLEAETRSPTVIKGIVEDLFSHRLEGARVSFRAHPESPFHRIETNADGTFRMKVPPLDPEQSYRLLVRASGHAPKLVPFQLGQPGEDVEVRALLGLGKALSGLVVDEYDAPIAGAVISAHLDLEGLAFQEPETITDERGRFFLPDLSNNIHLQARASGHLSQVMDLRLEEGEDLQIVLPHQGKLAGYVVDEESGKPVEHFRVTLLTRAPPGTSSSKYHPDPLAGSRRGITFSHEDGFFMMPAPQPGTLCTVRVKAKGYPPVTWEFKSAHEKDNGVQEILLSREGQTLTGFVHHQGVGLPQAKISAVMRHNSAQLEFPWDAYFKGMDHEWVYHEVGWTDADGNFEIYGLPTDGQIDLVVEREGMAIALARNVGGETRSQEMRRDANGNAYLHRSLGWTSTVLSMEPEVIFDIGINRDRFPEAMALQLRGLSDPLINRNFYLDPYADTLAIDKLAEGAYAVDLLAFDPQGHTVQISGDMLEVLSGEQRAVNLGFEPAFQVSGRIQMPPGNFEGDRLYLLPLERNKRRFRTVTDVAGNFVFDQIPAGDYDLLYLSKDPFYPDDFNSILEEHPNRTSLRVANDMIISPSFEPQTTITGCAGATACDWVFLVQGVDPYGNAIVREALADKNGCFRINHLPEGNYSLYAKVHTKDLPLVPRFRTKTSGETIDLGLIASNEPGRLNIHTSGLKEVSGLYDVIVYPKTGNIEQEEANLIAKESLEKPQANLLLENIPTGPVVVKVNITHEAAIAWPAVQQCRILPGMETRLEVRLVPVTRLDLVFDTLFNQITDMRLFHKTKGTAILGQSCTDLPQSPKNRDIMVCFSQDGARAFALEPGVWEVELVTKSGELKHAEITLEAGKVATLTL